MTTDTAESRAHTEPPTTLGKRLKLVGPGLILAAAGVGAGDMITGLEAGSRYGSALLWAVILGALVKFTLTEGVGRWYMSSGQTIVRGWRSLGRWLTAYILVHLLVLSFVYGAALPSVTALALDASFPGLLPSWVWGVLLGISGFVIVGIGRYGLFERIMEVLVLIMFVTVVGTAILTLPNLGDLALGVVPSLPEGSLLYAVSVVGGVGGTIGIASYGYWVRERGWRDSSWIPMMRFDSGVAYVLTGIFVLAMVIIGAQFLFGTGKSISDEAGVLALSDPIGERFGSVVSYLFLIGFFSVTYTSLIGGWNAFAYLFSDLIRTLRDVPDEEAQSYLSEKSPYFRGFLVYITFPPMILLVLGQPVFLVIIYAVLGALFQPILAITLLVLLNRRAAGEFRNGILANTVMGAIVLLFVALTAQEIVGLF